MEHNVRRQSAPLKPVDLLHQFLRDPVGRRFAPVGSHRVPLHRLQAQFPRNAEDRGPSRSEGRPKKLHRRTGNLLQRLAGLRELLAHATSARPSQVGMRPRMIPDGVPGRGDAPHQLRLRGRAAAEQKERGPHLVPRKNVEQPRRPQGIRAVVEGERQFARSRRRRDRRAEDAGTRPLRGIYKRAHGQARASRSAQPRVNSSRQSRDHSAW